MGVLFFDDGIITQWKVLVSNMSRELGINFGNALVLLIHFNWDETQLRNAWRCSPQQLYREVGISSDFTVRMCLDCVADSTGQICLASDTHVYQNLNPGCGHRCSDHLQIQLANQVSQGSLRLTCGKEGCVILQSCYALSNDSWLDYQALVTCSYTAAKNIFKCPRDCGMFYAIEETESWAANRFKRHHTTCPCGETFCPQCTFPVHFPARCEDLMAWRQQMEMPPADFITRFQILDQQIRVVDDILDDAPLHVVSPLDLNLMREYRKVLGWRRNLLIHYCFSPLTLLDLHDEDKALTLACSPVSIVFDSCNPWLLFKYDSRRLNQSFIESAIAMMARLLSKWEQIYPGPVFLTQEDMNDL